MEFQRLYAKFIACLLDNRPAVNQLQTKQKLASYELSKQHL